MTNGEATHTRGIQKVVSPTTATDPDLNHVYSSALEGTGLVSALLEGGACTLHQTNPKFLPLTLLDFACSRKTSEGTTPGPEITWVKGGVETREMHNLSPLCLIDRKYIDSVVGGELRPGEEGGNVEL